MYVTHYIHTPKIKVKVIIGGQRLKNVSAITLKVTKANYIKLHRKTRHHERYAMRHSQRLKIKSFLCITKRLLTTKASLIRHHEKVNNNEMMCHNQNQGSLPKVRVARKSKMK